MHRIAQNIKIEHINRKRDTFAILLGVTNATQIQGKLVTENITKMTERFCGHLKAPSILRNISSSLRKHKKTVHGPDSHVSGGKKPRPNPSRDNKKDPNDNFAKRGLKTTNIKGSKPITGLFQIKSYCYNYRNNFRNFSLDISTSNTSPEGHDSGRDSIMNDPIGSEDVVSLTQAILVSNKGLF